MSATTAADRVTHGFALTPGTVGVGLIVLLLTGGAAVWSRGRRTMAGAVVAEGADVTVASLEATPGEMGTVLYGGATYDQVSATVIDLAERGHLHARPLPSSLDGITLSWALELRAGQNSLRDYENVLLDELGVRKGPQEFPCLTNRSVGRVAGILHGAVVKQGWFTDDPQRARAYAYIWAGTGLLTGGVATIVLGMFTTWGVVGLGLVAGSLVALTVAGRKAVLTREGQQLAIRACSLQDDLTKRPRHVEPRCFAHAVALGVSSTFAADLDARGADTPDWITADDTIPITWTSVDDFALTARYGWGYSGSMIPGIGG